MLRHRPLSLPTWRMLFLLCICVGPILCGITRTWEANDVILHEEIGSKMLRFEGEKKELDYFKLLGHEQNRIIVGARNVMYNVSMTDLTHDKDRKLEWRPSSTDNKTCNHKLGEEYRDKCQNFITVFGKMDGGQYYVCGTNAFNPKCRTYEYQEADYPIQVPEFVSKVEHLGVGKSPYDPAHNSTAIYADNKLFSATVADIRARDPLIIESSERRIRTEQHNSNMLNDPHFVSSYDIDDKIYFFMREDAVENINCGKATFSRVARVCKKDLGGVYEDDVWTSFFKARLNCSIPGAFPFDFNELQSTSDFNFGSHKPLADPSKKQKMIYGVFNTPENIIQGSAVCAFSYEAIQQAFRGKFKGQETMSHNWLSIPHDKTPSPHPGLSCSNNSKTLSNDALSFIRNHPLMDMAVPASGSAPILISNGNGGRYTAITIDWQVLASHIFYDVMFIGTTDGRVLKAVNTGKEDAISSSVIEDIQVLGEDEPVTELKIFRQGTDHEKLIVISRKNIVSIPVHRCHRHKTCGDCVALQDPYCSWQDGVCRTATSRGLQDIVYGNTAVCPDGGRRSNKKGNGIAEVEVFITTTEKPVVETSCKPCECNCNKSDSSVTMETSQSANAEGVDKEVSYEVDNSRDGDTPPREPCETKYVRTEDQIYTASTLAIACVVAIVVAALIGFTIGYRVSLCRNHTRNTEAMINFEQHFGSLRKNPNRHSIEASHHNFYTEPVKTQKIQNVLVSNNIPQKNPNLPNGSTESRTMSPKQASKTYL